MQNPLWFNAFPMVQKESCFPCKSGCLVKAAKCKWTTCNRSFWEEWCGLYVKQEDKTSGAQRAEQYADLCWREVSMAVVHSQPVSRLVRWVLGRGIFQAVSIKEMSIYRNGLTFTSYGWVGVGRLFSSLSPYHLPAASMCRIGADCDLVTQPILTPGSLSSIQVGQIMFSL